MSLLLSDSHPAFTLSAPLVEYCGHFLQKHNLNYFQVIRVNQDGSSTLLTNRPDFTRFSIDFALKNNVPLIYSCAKKEVVDPSSYYFLWEPNLPAQPVAMVRNEFNICNGLTFVERFPTHYYMIAIGAPLDNHGVLDFYLNNIELIRNFIRGFRMEQQSLMQTLESQPLILAKPLQDENLESMLLDTRLSVRQRIPVTFKNHKSYITLKEYECIKQIPLGLSAKEIAKRLKLSPRTVEQYFERVKIRVGCRSKRDLIQLLS